MEERAIQTDRETPRERAAGAARRWWTALAAVVTGVAIFLAFPETDCTALAWVALVPLRLALELGGWRGRAAFGWGWLAGWIANCGGFFWITHLLVVFGHLPRPLALALYLALAAYQGLVFGLWSWATTTLARHFPRWLAPAFDALTLVAAEAAVPMLFPWLLGHSQYRFLPAAQLAELSGVPGLSAWLAGVAGGLALAGSQAVRRRWRVAPWPLLAVALLTALGLGWGAQRLAAVDQASRAAPRLRVALVEGDIGIARKARRDHVAGNLALHQRLSAWAASRGAELMVWPESAYDARWIADGTAALPPSPAPLARSADWEALLARAGHGDHLRLPTPLPPTPEPASDDARRVAASDRVAPQRGFTTPLLFGAVTWEPDPAPPAPGPRFARRTYNSALLLDAQGRLVAPPYRKNRLLLFGETLPLGRQLPWLYELVPEASSFTAGDQPGVFAWRGLRLGVTVCYEAILPGFVRRLGPPWPDLLFTLTNDAWFGPRGEPWLHLALTTFRAIEHRVPLIRSTNTGVSAFIDPAGRIVAHTDTADAEVLLHDVPLPPHPPTLYQRWGDWLSWGALGGVLGLLALVGRRRRRARASAGARELIPAEPRE